MPGMQGRALLLAQRALSLPNYPGYREGVEVSKWEEWMHPPKEVQDMLAVNMSTYLDAIEKELG